MLAIAKAGASFHLFAPDVEQHHVVNHFTGEATDEKRNVLVESARIARGKIEPLSKYNAADYDALLLPGGFGVAKNLSSIAFDGANANVNNEVAEAVKKTHMTGKPIAALCIAPALIAKVIAGVEVTIGNDPETTKAIEQMGGKHIQTTHGEVVTDKNNKVLTTPCYMLDADITQIAQGAENIVKALLEMIHQKK